MYLGCEGKVLTECQRTDAASRRARCSTILAGLSSLLIDRERSNIDLAALQRPENKAKA